VPSRPTRAQLGLGGAALALWLVGLVWFRPWIAHNDFAIFRIALERELSGHVRLVGAHSRLEVFHPGPLREWVFAIPYWLSGRRAASLPATALVLNAGWAVWTLVVARRLRPRSWGAACALGLLALVIALGPDLASPWNPHLAILPLYLGCWSAVTVMTRRGEGWAACICGATFAAQLHASALIVGGLLLAIAPVTLALWRRNRELVLALGLGAVLWSGPLADLRKGSDSNIVRLRTVGADGDSVGFLTALGHVSRLLWPGTPLGGTTVRPSVEVIAGFHRWWLMLVFVALGSILVWSTRPERHDDVDPEVADVSTWRAATGLALVLLALAVVSVSLFVEPAYRYLYGPLQAVAVFAIAVVVGAVVATAERRSDGPWNVMHRVSTVVVPVALVVVAVMVPRQDGPSAERRVLRVEDAVNSALAARPAWRTVEVIPLDLRGAGDLDAEILDVVVRRGVDARSRRSELGLPAPESVDGVFGVAMDAARHCLLADDDAEEIIRGTTASDEPFSVIAVDRSSTVYDRCIGSPSE
jgi:hypothetical protein